VPEDTAAGRLASRLRELRKQTGRSLKDLEAELHVSDSSLSRYFSGQSAPPWPVVEQLGRLAGQDVAELRGLWQEAGQRRRDGAGRRAGTRRPGAGAAAREAEETPSAAGRRVCADGRRVRRSRPVRGRADRAVEAASRGRRVRELAVARRPC
jgi:transcriptional regulator with XRE-family HTH domain